MKPAQEYTIGEVVRRLSREGFDISEHSLRVYERKGLMKPVSRQSGRFRRYTEADVRRLVSILKDLALGFEMADIRQLESEAERIHELRRRLAQGEISKEKARALLEELQFAKSCVRKYYKVVSAVKEREKFFADMGKDLEAAEDILYRMR